MIWTIVVLAVLVLVLFGFWVSWRASRLDRLHNRVESARTALDLALVRRSSAAADLASSGMIDPATSLLLADAVRRARQADPAELGLAESDLTRALRATLDEPGFRTELAENEGADRARRRGGGRLAPGLPRPQVLQRPGGPHARRPPPSRWPGCCTCPARRGRPSSSTSTTPW